jgi:tyrosyl-DNA phosphodiesterase 2
MQAEHIVADLNGHRNAVFGGDMRWCDDWDRPFLLPAGSVDAWTALQGQDSYRGWTYDSVWEVDATRFNSYIAKHNGMRKRSDRFVKDYKLSRIELIGDQSIGPTYSTKPEANYSSPAIDLTPSCHRGLVLTIVPNEQSSSVAVPGIESFLSPPCMYKAKWSDFSIRRDNYEIVYYHRLSL